jgi:hypothetical protein
MSAIHHLDETDEFQISELINSDPTYNIGDMIVIDFNNQMGDRMYKIGINNFTGRKISMLIERNDVPETFKVKSKEQAKDLLINDEVLYGDIVVLNDYNRNFSIVYTADMDIHGMIILNGDDGSILSDESYGGRRSRKRKTRKQKKNSHKRRKSHKRRTHRRRTHRR